MNFGKYFLIVGMCAIFATPMMIDESNTWRSALLVLVFLIVGAILAFLGQALIKFEEAKRRQARSPQAIQEAMARRAQ